METYKYRIQRQKVDRQNGDGQTGDGQNVERQKVDRQKDENRASDKTSICLNIKQFDFFIFFCVHFKVV